MKNNACYRKLPRLTLCLTTKRRICSPLSALSREKVQNYVNGPQLCEEQKGTLLRQRSQKKEDVKIVLFRPLPR